MCGPSSALEGCVILLMTRSSDARWPGVVQAGAGSGFDRADECQRLDSGSDR
jgi:hypothetical protein